jgi:hypothetical protein
VPCAAAPHCVQSNDDNLVDGRSEPLDECLHQHLRVCLRAELLLHMLLHIILPGTLLLLPTHQSL